MENYVRNTFVEYNSGFVQVDFNHIPRVTSLGQSSHQNSKHRLKTGSCCDIKFVVTGGTVGCHNNNLRWQLWQQRRHDDNSRISFRLMGFTVPEFSWNKHGLWQGLTSICHHVCSSPSSRQWMIRVWQFSCLRQHKWWPFSCLVVYHI